MISEDEIKVIKAQYNTHNQTLSTLEACTFGLIYLSVGDSIDLRDIAKEINSDNSKTPNSAGEQSIDESKAELLTLVGQKSADAFEQLLFRLNFTQQKDVMMEFYYLMVQQEEPCQKICRSLGIAVHMENTFKQLIYLLHNILMYDIMIRARKAEEDKAK